MLLVLMFTTKPLLQKTRHMRTTCEKSRRANEQVEPPVLKFLELGVWEPEAVGRGASYPEEFDVAWARGFGAGVAGVYERVEEGEGGGSGRELPRGV